MKTYCLIYHGLEEDGPCDLKVLGVSSSRAVLKAKKDALCKPALDHSRDIQDCEKINRAKMRGYLLDNVGAIDGFQHKEQMSPEETIRTIEFLVNNWTYSIAPGFADSNSFIRAYCNVAALKRPFPVLEPLKIERRKGPWYQPGDLLICKGPVLEESTL